jgi:hypothetical protein
MLVLLGLNQCSIIKTNPKVSIVKPAAIEHIENKYRSETITEEDLNLSTDDKIDWIGYTIDLEIAAGLD